MHPASSLHPRSAPLGPGSHRRPSRRHYEEQHLGCPGMHPGMHPGASSALLEERLRGWRQRGLAAFLETTVTPGAGLSGDREGAAGEAPAPTRASTPMLRVAH